MALINKNDFFSEMIPEHPHRRLHILLSILAICLIIGAIILYQRNYMNKEIIEDNNPSNILSGDELSKIIKDLDERNASTSPPSEEELKALMSSLNESNKDIKPLSGEELKKIIDSLEKNNFK